MSLSLSTTLTSARGRPDLPPRPGDGTPTHSGAATRAKIGALREKFTGFQNQWEMEAQQKAEREGTKIESVRDSITKLEGTLNSEIKRRVEANKALQAMFESQVATIQDRLEAVFLDRLDKLQTSVVSLADRMNTVESDFTLTREQYIKDIEDKNAMVAKDLNSMQNSFENEKINRRERELVISKKLGDHELRTQAALEAHVADREKRYQILRSELEEMREAMETGDNRFQSFILEEVAALKNGLVAESQTREQADDDIVQGLNHYTSVLQDALRIINQS